MKKIDYEQLRRALEESGDLLEQPLFDERYPGSEPEELYEFGLGANENHPECEEGEHFATNMDRSKLEGDGWDNYLAEHAGDGRIYRLGETAYCSRGKERPEARPIFWRKA